MFPNSLHSLASACLLYAFATLIASLPCGYGHVYFMEDNIGLKEFSPNVLWHYLRPILITYDTNVFELPSQIKK